MHGRPSLTPLKVHQGPVWPYHTPDEAMAVISRGDSGEVSGLVQKAKGWFLQRHSMVWGPPSLKRPCSLERPWQAQSRKRWQAFFQLQSVATTGPVFHAVHFPALLGITPGLPWGNTQIQVLSGWAKPGSPPWAPLHARTLGWHWVWLAGLVHRP